MRDSVPASVPAVHRARLSRRQDTRRHPAETEERKGLDLGTDNTSGGCRTDLCTYQRSRPDHDGKSATARGRNRGPGVLANSLVGLLPWPQPFPTGGRLRGRDTSRTTWRASADGAGPRSGTDPSLWRSTAGRGAKGGINWRLERKPPSKGGAFITPAPASQSKRSPLVGPRQRKNNETLETVAARSIQHQNRRCPPAVGRDEPKTNTMPYCSWLRSGDLHAFNTRGSQAGTAKQPTS